MKTRKINKSFNTWAKKKKAENIPADASQYSVTRDRGTVKAEALLSRLTKPGGKMPVPPPLPRVAR